MAAYKAPHQIFKEIAFQIIEEIHYVKVDLFQMVKMAIIILFHRNINKAF